LYNSFEVFMEQLSCEMESARRDAWAAGIFYAFLATCFGVMAVLFIKATSEDLVLRQESGFSYMPVYLLTVAAIAGVPALAVESFRALRSAVTGRDLWPANEPNFF
jgi:hypothetical protein